jgi:hypothetical protein
VGALEMATAEEQGILAAIKGGASGAANPIANLIPCDGAEHDRKEKPLQRNNAGGGKDACGDEKGITRKKKANEEAGFYEDDCADKGSAARAD